MRSNSKQSVISAFLLHLHPQVVNEQAIRNSRTFGLGGISALLFVILAVTGMYLRFAYVPVPENAYDSIVFMQNNTLFGTLVRNIHHWSAMLMIVTVTLHLLRVFYSQSVYYERKKNWYYGLVLFVIVLAFNFTGYLLPWDQLSYWAVTIMTNIVEYIPFAGSWLANLIRGGEIVDENTLLNFYNFHTALLPLLMVVFMVLHFWLVRKAKGVTVADSTNGNMVKVNPVLLKKEVITALFVIAAVIFISLFFNAPLLEKANPLISPNPSKAPWYFMGIQELLINLHPVIATLVIPVLLILFFVYLPKTAIDKNRVGQWYYSPKGKKIVVQSVIFTTVFTSVLIIILEYLLHLNELDIALFVATGIIPLLMYLIPAGGFVFYIKKKFEADIIEIAISAATIIFTSYIVMSVFGIWFRGESMHLIF